MGSVVRSLHSQMSIVRDAGAMLLISATSNSSNVVMDGAAESETSLGRRFLSGLLSFLPPLLEGLPLLAFQEPH